MDQLRPTISPQSTWRKQTNGNIDNIQLKDGNLAVSGTLQEISKQLKDNHSKVCFPKWNEKEMEKL